MAGPKKLPPSYEPPHTNCHPSANCEKGFYRVDEQAGGEVHAYSSTLRNEEAGTVIFGYLTTIKEATDAIIKKLDTHADLFMRRWRWSNPKKREELLRNIVPYIAPNPWHCFRYEDNALLTAIPKQVRNPETRHQLLLPWLDLETLKMHPDVLLALLHYRTHYPPQSWAAFDIKQLDLGWKRGYLEVRLARKWVVVHGPRYGEVIDWDVHVSHRADVLGFPRAELLFEAQAYLMTTLRDIVRGVLNGVDETTPARTAKWSQLIDTCEFRRTKELEIWSPYVFPAFSPPPTLDLRQLTSLANARLEANRDHLWQLQCNPAYVRRQMQLFLGTQANTDPGIISRTMLFANHIMREVFNYIMWRWVEIECKKVEEMQRRLRDTIYPGQTVRPEFNKAIRELELMLVNIVNNTTARMLEDITTSKSLPRGLAVRRTLDGGTRIELKEVEKQESGSSPLWCLVHMTTPPDIAHLSLDKALLIYSLESYLSYRNFRESNRVKGRINEFIYRWLADVSAFSEMLVSIRLGRPQPTCADSRGMAGADHREEWWFIANPPRPTEVKAPYHLAERLVRDFFNASPPRGLRDLEWLQYSRATRAGLENFWSSIYDLMTAAIRQLGISEDATRQFLQVITASQSIKYKQVVLAEETKVLAELKQQRKALEAVGQLGESLEKMTMEKTVAKPRRGKTKKRRQGGKKGKVAPAKKETKSQNKAPDSDPASTRALVRITKQALKAMELMFPTNAEEASKGLLWTDFVLAMKDMGFIARHEGGSAVSFETEDKEEIIVFHRPHPDRKIDPVVLQAMGTRMNRRFGWTRENFALGEV
ncbi:hypothetical protein O1611_g4349 [Lasiodiplodia mahajangana]|uniref:Uncharacterized protein n=1 Tax=Lasiodiplodia mahajangana TaxID=1108764 RepID=A0ACC2JPT1_9PEZI|nr:hypothetical protein O1611_g4349 [Lasiodiplodia mahajangana]